MGLLDVLNGMQNEPRGQQNPTANKGGMPPMVMAVLGLLGYKVLKSFAGQPGANPAAPDPAMRPAGATGQNPSTGGGLGDLLKGNLGGLFAGGAAGGVLSGGLNDLLKQFQQSGQSDVANSWVSAEPNKAISPGELAKALGADQIKTLTAHTGMSRDELLAGLSRHLPEVVNQLTPQGRLPTAQELSRSI